MVSKHALIRSDRFFVHELECILLRMSGGENEKATRPKAPKEDPAPMPHINNDSSVMNISVDKSTNVWRDVIDYSNNPKRDAGPINIQRYEIQLEPVGIKTFFQRTNQTNTG